MTKQTNISVAHSNSNYDDALELQKRARNQLRNASANLIDAMSLSSRRDWGAAARLVSAVVNAMVHGRPYVGQVRTQCERFLQELEHQENTFGLHRTRR